MSRAFLLKLIRTGFIKRILLRIMHKYDDLAADVTLFYLRERLGYVGQNVKIGRGVHVEHPENVHIADNAVIHHRVYIHAHSKVFIDNGARIAEGVAIVTPTHDFQFTGEECSREVKSKETRIGKDSVLNTRCMVLGGVNVGDGAIVAAHSLVVQDVSPNTYVIGVPARPFFKRKLKESGTSDAD